MKASDAEARTAMLGTDQVIAVMSEAQFGKVILEAMDHVGGPDLRRDDIEWKVNLVDSDRVPDGEQGMLVELERFSVRKQKVLHTAWVLQVRWMDSDQWRLGITVETVAYDFRKNERQAEAKYGFAREMLLRQIHAIDPEPIVLHQRTASDVDFTAAPLPPPPRIVDAVGLQDAPPPPSASSTGPSQEAVQRAFATQHAPQLKAHRGCLETVEFGLSALFYLGLAVICFAGVAIAASEENYGMAALALLLGLFFLYSASD